MLVSEQIESHVKQLLNPFQWLPEGNTYSHLRTLTSQLLLTSEDGSIFQPHKFHSSIPFPDFRNFDDPSHYFSW